MASDLTSFALSGGNHGRYIIQKDYPFHLNRLSASKNLVLLTVKVIIKMSKCVFFVLLVVTCVVSMPLEQTENGE